MADRFIKILAILSAALALIPSAAHLLELPNKMKLGRDAYLTVQGIYAGWAWLGILDFAALGSAIALAVALRRQRGPFSLAVLAVLAVAGFFAVFFAWTYPANRATANWTTLPDSWEALRRQWEYSHAASAALLCVTLAVLLSRRDAPDAERQG